MITLHIYKFYMSGEIRWDACTRRKEWMEDEWEYLGTVEIEGSTKSDEEIVLAGLEKEEEELTAKYLVHKKRIEARRQELMALTCER
jgi:hypothetical protein